ncbi:MAG: ABC transporter permease [Bacteroidota bacterium]
MAEETVTATPVTAETNGVAIDPKNAKKRPDQSYWSLVKHQFKKNRSAVWALYFIYFLVVVALLADVLANDKPILCSYKGTFYAPVFKDYAVGLGLAKYSPDLVNADWKSLKYDWAVFPPIKYSASATDIMASFQPPFQSGSDHYFGTDQPGRDVLSGLVHGARISLSIGLISMGIATVIGVFLGALAGYFGGWVDNVISRITEVFLNFPTLFLILAIVAFYGASVFLVMVVIGITGWMGIARLVRGEVLRVRNLEYVTAANSLGFTSMRVIFRHVLPNSIAPVLVSIAFGIAGAILTESALSFLGFGVPIETVTWGSALNQSRTATFAWWLAVFPGMMIFLTAYCYNMVGDGLRDATDPRLRD